MHRASEPLIVRSSLRFQAYHIKGKVLGCNNALDQVCKVVLSSTSKKYGKSVLLFRTESYEVCL